MSLGLSHNTKKGSLWLHSCHVVCTCGAILTEKKEYVACTTLWNVVDIILWSNTRLNPPGKVCQPIPMVTHVCLPFCRPAPWKSPYVASYSDNPSIHSFMVSFVPSWCLHVLPFTARTFSHSLFFHTHLLKLHPGGLHNLPLDSLICLIFVPLSRKCLMATTVLYGTEHPVGA